MQIMKVKKLFVQKRWDTGIYIQWKQQRTCDLLYDSMLLLLLQYIIQRCKIIFSVFNIGCDRMIDEDFISVMVC